MPRYRYLLVIIILLIAGQCRWNSRPDWTAGSSSGLPGSLRRSGRQAPNIALEPECLGSVEV